jgi:hypothetical protein
MSPGRDFRAALKRQLEDTEIATLNSYAVNKRSFPNRHNSN